MSSNGLQVDDRSEQSNQVVRRKDSSTQLESREEVMTLSGQKPASKGSNTLGNLRLRLEDDNKNGHSFTTNALTRAIKNAENVKKSQKSSTGRRTDIQQKVLDQTSITGQGDQHLQAVVAEDDGHTRSTQPLTVSDKELSSKEDEGDENLDDVTAHSAEVTQQRLSAGKTQSDESNDSQHERSDSSDNKGKSINF